MWFCIDRHAPPVGRAARSYSSDIGDGGKFNGGARVGVKPTAQTALFGVRQQKARKAARARAIGGQNGLARYVLISLRAQMKRSPPTEITS
jgi:hypothetical protein